MHMRTLLIILICNVSFWSLNAQTFFTTDYIALTVPQHYSGTMCHIDESLKQKIRNVEDLPNNNKLLNSFPNSVSNVYGL